MPRRKENLEVGIGERQRKDDLQAEVIGKVQKRRFHSERVDRKHVPKGLVRCLTKEAR